MSANHKALARRLVDEAFGAGRLDVIDEIVTDDFVGYDAALPEDTRGREALKQNVMGYRTAFPDLTIEILDQIADGDRVVTRWRASGTHQGDLMGIAPTGKQATSTGITIDRIVDGMIAESWTNWDTLGLLQQLGAVPAPATA